ncbi:hypothetical protein [Nocardioides sp. KR10-350]|uniref:hypothetical protein n=1 Tax=Nocardioides cheoyonin TaxID=3156615 RepID=UPI0032B54118
MPDPDNPPSHDPAPAEFVLVDPPYGTSRLAAELYALPRNLRRTLRVPDHLIAVIDALVTVVDGLTDDTGPANMNDRAEKVFEGEPLTKYLAMVPGGLAAEPLETYLSQEIPRAIRMFDGKDPRGFTSRLLGAARYHRLEQALKKDLEVVLVGARRVSRWTLPFALALEDICEPLGQGAMTEIFGGGWDGGFLDLIVEGDRLIEKAVGWAAPGELIRARPEEREPLTADALRAMTDEIRDVIAGQTSEILNDLKDTFRRKMQGARDALAFSSDAVSQASSSLIEFIDRLLRDAFSDDEVLAWLDENFESKKDLVFSRRDGIVRPTKRAQALCLAYGRTKIEQRNALNELAASSLVAARARLQQLKHADDGTPEEREQVVMALAAVEGFLMIVVRLSWASVPKDRLQALQMRFRPPAPGEVVTESGDEVA